MEIFSDSEKDAKKMEALNEQFEKQKKFTMTLSR